MKLPIYLDHHATTPVDVRVLDEMLPYFSEIFGNAASIDHEYGYEGLQAVNLSREKIANALGTRSPEEIVFTSGATEADNLALLGVAEKYQDKGKHIITTKTEHKAILDTCEFLDKNGWDISYIPVNQDGQINLDELKSSIRPDTVLMSVIAANNEIGTIAPLKEIGEIAKNHEILFHTDATQAVGYLPIDVEELNIDLLSLSGHKIYGPKGIGALYVRNSRPRVKIAEQLHGGGHERGMRSGTLNVPGIVGLGKALEISITEMEKNNKHIKYLRDLLWESIQNGLDGVELNGHSDSRLPHNLSFYISGIETKSLLVMLKDDLAMSTGSACTSATVRPSHVILALGYGEQRAYSSIRIGLGRNNTQEEICFCSQKLVEAIQKLRKLNQ
jgi:cysteine desulfurase